MNFVLKSLLVSSLVFGGAVASTFAVESETAITKCGPACIIIAGGIDIGAGATSDKAIVRASTKVPKASIRPLLERQELKAQRL